jgi:hypothetical protein
MKRMKNEKPDELDDNQSIFAIARHHRNRTISKTTRFADISVRSYGKKNAGVTIIIGVS